jgi:hypothetical protein
MESYYIMLNPDLKQKMNSTLRIAGHTSVHTEASIRIHAGQEGNHPNCSVQLSQYTGSAAIFPLCQEQR